MWLGSLIYALVVYVHDWVWPLCKDDHKRMTQIEKEMPGLAIINGFCFFTAQISSESPFV